MQINEFLKKEKVKKVIDIKFDIYYNDNIKEQTYLITYEENMDKGIEDPQIYE